SGAAVVSGGMVGVADALEDAEPLRAGCWVSWMVGVASLTHAASPRARARSEPASRRRGKLTRLGLVRVVAQVCGGDRRHGAVGQQARLATQQPDLGAQPAGRIGQFQQLL